MAQSSCIRARTSPTNLSILRAGWRSAQYPRTSRLVSLGRGRARMTAQLPENKFSQFARILTLPARKKGHPTLGAMAFENQSYLSLISLCNCCKDLISRLPCLRTDWIPFAVALAAAAVVMYGILPLMAALRR